MPRATCRNPGWHYFFSLVKRWSVAACCGCVCTESRIFQRRYDANSSGNSNESVRKMYEECYELTCSPWDLRFTQDVISARFRPPYSNLTVYDAVRQILDGRLDPDEFPRIRVMRHDGQLWCVDNRRLYVFRLSKIRLITVSVVATQSSVIRSLDALSRNVLLEMSTEEYFPLIIWVRKVRSTLDSFIQMMRIWIPGYNVDSTTLRSKYLGSRIT